MATSFDAIENLALVTINDYRIAKLYNQSEEGFEAYMDGFLLRGVPYFHDCRQPLTYDAALRQFSADLTPMEQAILADFLVLEHFRRDKHTASSYLQKLQNSGSFKNHSEAAHMKEMSADYDKLLEQLSRDLQDYQTMALDTYL